MFVACSTLCFAREPLDKALRQIAELEFDKFELAIIEDGHHLRPSEVADDPESALQKLRKGPSLTPSAVHVDFGPIDWNDPMHPPPVRGHLSIRQVAQRGRDHDALVPARHSDRSRDQAALRNAGDSPCATAWCWRCLTHSDTLTGDPQIALQLCKALPGLGLTLDPSHFILNQHAEAEYDPLYPYVQNIHLRDTGKNPGEFQVRVGQGQVEYARVVTQLQRYGYNRSLTVAIIDRLDNPFDREVEVRKLKLLLETLL